MRRAELDRVRRDYAAVEMSGLGQRSAYFVGHIMGDQSATLRTGGRTSTI
jgi:hypothetical protein